MRCPMLQPTVGSRVAAYYHAPADETVESLSLALQSPFQLRFSFTQAVNMVLSHQLVFGRVTIRLNNLPWIDLWNVATHFALTTRVVGLPEPSYKSHTRIQRFVGRHVEAKIGPCACLRRAKTLLRTMPGSRSSFQAKGLFMDYPEEHFSIKNGCVLDNKFVPLMSIYF